MSDRNIESTNDISVKDMAARIGISFIGAAAVFMGATALLEGNPIAETPMPNTSGSPDVYAPEPGNGETLGSYMITGLTISTFMCLFGFLPNRLTK